MNFILEIENEMHIWTLSTCIYMYICKHSIYGTVIYMCVCVHTHTHTHKYTWSVCEFLNIYTYTVVVVLRG